ncbi:MULTISPECIES: cysteine desulfurase NifS [Clostridium]|jgi:cysteine desulfurase|uniref:cysteine desulfurase NifS n=1 Tax=Clostridium TaxID=1485 RepID=UPI000287F7F7|nr:MULTISPECIES: cysteine desulfurase NifS [Clostridium]MDF2505119.1 cysteine desulfurase NifS [Clostridium sp.]
MNYDKKLVYLDYGASTPMNKEVFKEIEPYFYTFYGNPSSVSSFSEKSKMAIYNSRERIAKAINCQRNEIYFTSGGTESDNWAIKGIALKNRDKGNHIITTKIEHPAVINTCKYLEELGFKITYLPVDKYGIVNLEYIKNAITENTILVSIMFANNEIGSIQPISEIGKLCREKGIIFHTDGVQAVGHIPIDVEKMNIDMLSMSAHKFYGPKGIGVLYIKRGVKIDGFIHGGHQERGRRAGTENTPGIVGIGKAIELCTLNMEKESERISALRNKLLQGILEISGTELNGSRENKRLPGNLNVCFNGIDAEILLMSLDLKGICASAGSACSAGSIRPSHVLSAIGLSPEKCKSSLRFSIGEETSEEDIDYTISTLKEIIGSIRTT